MEMKKKNMFSVAIIILAVLVVIRSLYYMEVPKDTLNIILVSFVAALIAGMYIVRFSSKDKSAARLLESKNIWAGVFASLSLAALVADGIYRIFTTLDLETAYNDLIENGMQSVMSVVLIIRSVFGFIFAILLIILAIEHFTGNKKISEKNFLLTVPMLWGGIRLLEFVSIDGYFKTSAIKGIEIIGIVFLVLNLLSILRMHSYMYKPKHFIKLVTQACISIPIVLTSSIFGIIDALTGPVKCNIISYISEICLAMFVLSTLRAAKPTDLSECEKNYYFNFKFTFAILNIATLFSACLCIVLAIFFRFIFVLGFGMMDTIHDEDKVLICSFMYEPKNNDIVVINPLESLTESRKQLGLNGKERIISRVIAVEGQKLRIDFDSQKVYVDGKEIDEPYRSTPMKKPTRDDLETNNYGNIPDRIPEGYVFVMGDNRENSSDSRYGEIGLIPTEKVLGKVVFRYWPFDQIKVF